jgi:ABC-type spermidine/putrescine transport system permease subunit I
MLRYLNIRTALLAPGILVVVAFAVTPLCFSFLNSVRVSGAWSLGNFETVLTNEPYFTVFANSLVIATLTTLLTLLLAMPACAYFARRGSFDAGLFIAAVTLALTVSLLVRTYAWQVLLSYNGILNDISLTLGLSSKRLRILYTKTSVLLVLVQVMLPYACLVIFTSMRNIDHDLLLAARTLGAGPIKTFREAYWPQVSNSVIMAGVIVFTGSAGSFVTPALIGGPDETMIGMQIQADLVVNYINGNGLAAAAGTVLGIVLLVLTGLAVLATRRSFVVSAEQAGS